MGFWDSLKRPAQDSTYRLERLVDNLLREEAGKGGVHIVCDIDKTYLETEFESLIRMARIAFEAASDKVTVAGASEVLQLARWGDVSAALPPSREFPRCLHFVSSSPPQLRTVLAEKMMMDGLDWTSDTFKNQVYNLRMGRMDLLRQHVAYKSLALLNLVAKAEDEATFYLIGDNAESDAYIYTGIKLLLDGRLNAATYQAYLEAAGVESKVAQSLASLVKERKRVGVAAVLIRRVPGYAMVEQPPLTDSVQTFDDFFQAALLLMAHGLIGSEHLWPLARSFHNHHGMTQRQLAQSLQAVSAAPVLTQLRQAAADALQRLTVATKSSSTASALERSLGVTPARLNQLTGSDILRHARLWQQRMAAAKDQREDRSQRQAARSTGADRVK